LARIADQNDCALGSGMTESAKTMISRPARFESIHLGENPVMFIDNGALADG